MKTDDEIRAIAARHDSQVSMAKEMNLSRERVRQLCDRAGIHKFRVPSRRRPPGQSPVDKAIADLETWVLQLLSIGDLVKLLGFSAHAIQSRVGPLGKCPLSQRIRGRTIQSLWNRGMTYREIATVLTMEKRQVLSDIGHWRHRGLYFEYRIPGVSRRRQVNALGGEGVKGAERARN